MSHLPSALSSEITNQVVIWKDILMHFISRCSGCKSSNLTTSSRRKIFPESVTGCVIGEKQTTASVTRVTGNDLENGR
jgi:hypothetical protein